MEEPEVAVEERVLPMAEAKDVKIHLKDGTVLRAKILSQDNQQMNVETSMGKLAIAQKDVLKIELLKEKIEEKLVKVYLKDGTVLRAKILSEDEQKIYVDPDNDMIVVFTADIADEDPHPTDYLFRLIRRAVVSDDSIESTTTSTSTTNFDFTLLALSVISIPVSIAIVIAYWFVKVKRNKP